MTHAVYNKLPFAISKVVGVSCGEDCSSTEVERSIGNLSLTGLRGSHSSSGARAKEPLCYQNRQTN